MANLEALKHHHYLNLMEMETLTRQPSLTPLSPKQVCLVLRWMASLSILQRPRYHCMAALSATLFRGTGDPALR